MSDAKLVPIRKERLLLEAHALMGAEDAAQVAKLERDVEASTARLDAFESLTGNAKGLPAAERERRTFEALRTVIESHYESAGDRAANLSRATVAARLQALAALAPDARERALEQAFGALYETVPDHVLCSAAAALGAAAGVLGSSGRSAADFDPSVARQALASYDTRQTLDLFEHIDTMSQEARAGRDVARALLDSYQLATNSADAVVRAVDRLLEGDATPRETSDAIERLQAELAAGIGALPEVPPHVAVVKSAIASVAKAAAIAAGA